MDPQLSIYFDTVPLDTGLAEAKLKAGKLNRLIYDYLKSHSKDYTPSELWIILNKVYPITSVRRSLTTMTRPEYGIELLKMTGKKRIGMYGSPENSWEIR